MSDDDQDERWEPSRNAWCSAQRHFQVNLTGDRLSIREDAEFRKSTDG